MWNVAMDMDSVGEHHFQSVTPWESVALSIVPVYYSEEGVALNTRSCLLLRGSVWHLAPVPVWKVWH